MVTGYHFSRGCVFVLRRIQTHSKLVEIITDTCFVLDKISRDKISKFDKMTSIQGNELASDLLRDTRSLCTYYLFE